ncbi:MAG TPA: ATP-binding protein, partial [Steroidobacteraceae bacterium]|nr:ATP-binding protein [Steroidobacteraceae bacterium]
TTAILFPDTVGRIAMSGERHSRDSLEGADADIGAAQWAFDHSKPAGLGTNTLAGARVLYLPLIAAQRTLGVLAVKPSNPRRVMLPEQFRLLETFAAQIASALERTALADQARSAEVRAETEAVRNSLLASLSHDLRTPLSTIVGGAATLSERMEDLKPEERRALAGAVRNAASHVSEHVTSMLHLVQLESGAIRLRFDWYALDEIVGTVLHRLKDRLATHSIVIDMPKSLQAARIDGKLIEQVIENLLDNVIKYTPADSEIRISAATQGNQLEVTIADTGPGFEGADSETLFQKFERGKREGTVDGIGLGLAICRAIIELHHGHIWAEERQPHGAAIHFTLPIGVKDTEAPWQDD